MDTGQEDHQDHEETGVATPRRPRHHKGDTPTMVAVLARGGTQAEAAAAADISEREVRRRSREPEVARLLRSARHELERQMMAKLGDAGFEALETMRELLGKDQPVETRFKASKELLHAAVHNLDSLAAREELDDIQAQVDALQSSDATELEP
jgi:hypothetical protein